ncbi:MAG TPA: MBL fold metallo-hydrolase [Steroidobacteraceae bacterium]|jgi:cyclase|nr:MBL fold metallo-hydrolase [Steroidobacteraceae bacterium]
MNNWIRPLAVGVLAAVAGIAAAQQQDFSKVEIKVTKVAGNVYLLEGAGGNIAASVGDDGIVIVDDQFAPLADKIRAALKGITTKPLRFIINTHYHFDHTGGNLPFHDATIIAHDNVRKRLAQANVVGNGGSAMKMDQPANPPEALPVITFAHDVTLHVNGEDIRALHAPSGHTDGDSIVFFPKSNVVHFGDDFVRYGFPFIDINGGGSSKGMIAALENAMTQLPKDVKVIPGHGALATLDDVRSFVTMLKETRGVVEKGVKAGKTLQQLQQEKVLAQWEKYSGQFVSTDLFIETLYNELTGKKVAALVKHN